MSGNPGVEVGTCIGVDVDKSTVFVAVGVGFLSVGSTIVAVGVFDGLAVPVSVGMNSAAECVRVIS